jgi:hypothetical protein
MVAGNVQSAFADTSDESSFDEDSSEEDKDSGSGWDGTSRVLWGNPNR